MGHQLGRINGIPLKDRGDINLRIREAPHPVYKRATSLNDKCKNIDCSWKIGFG
jgi:hypothetical protein